MRGKPQYVESRREKEKKVNKRTHLRTEFRRDVFGIFRGNTAK